MATALFGCGGISTAGNDSSSPPPFDRGETAAAGSSGGSAAAGSSGGSMAAVAGSGPGVGECYVVYPNLGLTECEALERFVALHDVRIDDEDGDGRVSPGELIGISVTLSEITGAAMVAYPGVAWETSDPGLALERPGFDGPTSYALPPCESVGGSAIARISEALEPGTVLRVTARAASLNQDCPNATAVVIPIVVSAPGN